MDTAYYRERAVEERARALSAERQDVAAIHEELARLYQALVDQVELRPTMHIASPGQDERSAKAWLPCCFAGPP